MSRTHRRFTFAALATALSLAAPAVVSAATITYSRTDGGAVVYTADPGETLNTGIDYQANCGSGQDCVRFAGDTVTLGDDLAHTVCVADSGREVCPLDPDHSGIRVLGGAGNDQVTLYDAGIGGFPAGSPYAITVDGGEGNDTLLGGSADETLDGGPGADALTGMGGNDTLDGGDGNDTLGGDSDAQHNDVSEGGNDVLHGGAGDDRLTGDASSTNAVIGHDVLDGGPGIDTVYDDWHRFDGSGGSEDPPPSVTLDGQANDGRPGENDAVLGVEKIDTGYSGGTGAVYVGSDAAETFNLLFVDGSVSAGGGDDVVTGADGADVIDGGAGNDQLSGGFGDDTITGGPGQDDISGDRTAACFYGPIYGSCTIGSGNDTIYAVDGERDTIDCGPGADVAYVDVIDVVANCETVHVAVGSGPPPVPPRPPAPHLTPCGATQPGCTPPPVAVLGRPQIGGLSHQHLRTLARKRTLVLSCRMAAAGRCSIRASITATSARKLRLKPRHGARTFTLGRGARRFRQAGSGTVHLKLSRGTARALGRVHRLRITFTATASYRGSRRTTTKPVTFKR